MMGQNTLWRALFQRLRKVGQRKCKHELETFTRIESGKLSEPGEPEREVRIRMLYARCKKCAPDTWSSSVWRGS